MTMRAMLSVLLAVLVCGLAAERRASCGRLLPARSGTWTPMVSPDGKHLVFSSNRTGSYNLYLITFGESGVLLS